MPWGGSVFRNHKSAGVQQYLQFYRDESFQMGKAIDRMICTDYGFGRRLLLFRFKDRGADQSARDELAFRDLIHLELCGPCPLRPFFFQVEGAERVAAVPLDLDFNPVASVAPELIRDIGFIGLPRQKDFIPAVDADPEGDSAPFRNIH